MAVSAVERFSPWPAVAALAVLAAFAVVHSGHAAPPDAPAASPAAQSSPPGTADLDMEGFLDRLMIAESGGRLDARNPRSTALGPYQFIESTWLDLTRRLFITEVQGKTPAQVLALRTDRAFARKAAQAFTLENAQALRANGFDATFPRLRLAFLLGPHAAVRVLQAPPRARVTALLGPKVANANPFMYGMTAAGLVARAAHDLAVPPSTVAGLAPADASRAANAAKAPPRIAVRCNLALISCRRWQALAIARANAPKSSVRAMVSKARVRVAR